MQRFIFHVDDGSGFPDPDPVEFASVDLARREAVRFAGELLLDHVENFAESGRIDLHVSTGDGEHVIKISVSASAEAASLCDMSAGRRLRLASVGGS